VGINAIVAVGGLPGGMLRRVTAYIESNLHRDLRLAKLAACDAHEPVSLREAVQKSHRPIPASLRGAATHSGRDHTARDVHILDQLDRTGGGVQNRQSFRDDGSAHYGRDAERLPRTQSRRRAPGHDAGRSDSHAGIIPTRPK
jgi:hypothetical protein